MAASVCIDRSTAPDIVILFRVSALVAWVAELSAGLVRGLRAVVEVGAAALDTVVGCLL